MFYDKDLRLVFYFSSIELFRTPDTLKDEFGKIRIFGTFLGKVPKYGYMVSPVRWDTYFLANRVEYQRFTRK